MRNLILSTDSYKYSHFLQYPPGTEKVYSYIEARKGSQYEDIVFFGLQAFIDDYLKTPITLADINEAAKLIEMHGLPFNANGWHRILSHHRGYLPIIIKALPEGTVAKKGDVLLTVENTDPELPWLTTFIETALLRAIWYPTTVATVSRETKKIIYAGLVKTCDNPDQEISFRLHDFGARGVSSAESAKLGGMGHLVNFMGSDTVEALVGARMHYDEPMAGFSIPASEHSTITSWGREGELAAFENMLDKFEKSPIISCVSDSYDIYHAVSQYWGTDLHDKVVGRKGTLVIRPDSGHPPSVVADILMRLATKFGYSTNKKGFKVLSPCVRVIQGDGCTPAMIQQIIDKMIDVGYSVENVAFGMGGGLLQKVDRDTLSFAMKASAVRINGEWKDVYKDPITSTGKISKKGRFDSPLLTTHYDLTYHGVTGKVALATNVTRSTFAEIRERAKL